MKRRTKSRLSEGRGLIHAPQHLLKQQMKAKDDERKDTNGSDNGNQYKHEDKSQG